MKIDTTPMTLLECYTKMRDMWQWLALHPEKDKNEYAFIGKIPLNTCYACEWVFQSRPNTACCSNVCPCRELWNGGGCSFNYSAFILWSGSLKDLPKRSQYAQQIADFCQEKITDITMKPVDRCSYCGLPLYLIQYTTPNWVDKSQPPLCKSCWEKCQNKPTDKPRVVDNPDLTVPIPCDNCSVWGTQNTCKDSPCPTEADLVNKVIEERAKSTAVKVEQPPAPKYKVGDWVKVIHPNCTGYGDEYQIYCYDSESKDYMLLINGEPCGDYCPGWLEPAPEQTFKVGDKIKGGDGRVYKICLTQGWYLVCMETGMCWSNSRSMDTLDSKGIKDYIGDGLDKWLTNGRFTRVE